MSLNILQSLIRMDRSVDVEGLTSHLWHENWEPRPIRRYVRMRRMMEVPLALLLVFCLSPLLLMIALLVRLTGPGPIIYTQMRSGLHRTPFRLYKFRTMGVNAENDGPTWAAGDDDPRVTRIGRFLRASHLDELPQIWNVVRGEMSFIGPRPERPEYDEVLVQAIPSFYLRYLVPPGITGWAQVRAGYVSSVLGSQRKLELDLFYILNLSPGIDFMILLTTLNAIGPWKFLSRAFFKVSEISSKTSPVTLADVKNGIRHLSIAVLIAWAMFATSANAAEETENPSENPKQTAPSAPDCGLPVCNMEDFIEELRGLREGQRADRIKAFVATWKESENPLIYRNILDATTRAKAFFEEVKEQEWVIRETVLVQDFARSGLLRFDRPNFDQLKAIFDQIVSERPRYDVMSFWTKNARRLQRLDELKALLEFADHAYEWATRTKQEDWMIREPINLRNAATLALALVEPAHEGVYRIRTQCVPSPGSCNQVLLKMDQLVVMESTTYRGLIVSFSIQADHLAAPYFQRANLLELGTKIEATSVEWSAAGVVNISINPETGQLTGNYQDNASAGLIKFTGTPIRRAVTFFRDKGPSRQLSLDDVVGRYKARIGDFAGEFMVRRALKTGAQNEPELVGTFVSSKRNGQEFAWRRDFHVGNFQALAGVMTFYSTGTGRTTDSKIVIGVRDNGRGAPRWTGFMMTATTPVMDVLMEKLP
jgi:lipopolysaccharide/colanic/teichoic acid biosynthesis glycosyltransferase